jgi:hypothetical protein
VEHDLEVEARPADVVADVSPRVRILERATQPFGAERELAAQIA